MCTEKTQNERAFKACKKRESKSYTINSISQQINLEFYRPSTP